jgi:hypothetical protein
VIPGASRLTGVSNGTRTRDIRHHKAALYQLSYTHHQAPVSARGRRTLYWLPAVDSESAPASGTAPVADGPESPVIAPACFAAMRLAVSESGPGGATKTASR